MEAAVCEGGGVIETAGVGVTTGSATAGSDAVESVERPHAATRTKVESSAMRLLPQKFRTTDN